MSTHSACVDSSRPGQDPASGEREFLCEAYKGVDDVVLDDDASNNDKALSQIPASTMSFRFLDLPAELRYRVYSFVLPTDMTITFERLTLPKGQSEFVAFGLERHGREPISIGRKTYYDSARARRKDYFAVETQLFRVSKFVSNEAQSVLYGMNTYSFTVYGRALWPTSMRSPYIFGAFGHPHRLSLLRNLRRIRIHVVRDIDSHWAVKRQRARLEYLVEILKEHADDDNQKSLLQDLTVGFGLASAGTGSSLGLHPLWRYVRLPSQSESEKFMFGLESLAALRGIKDVQITGLPEWYARCLQLCIQGKGGQVQETDWPLMQVKRRVGGLSRRKKTYWVTLRKWHQPMLNWMEFAERNGIPVPDNISKFWEAQ